MTIAADRTRERTDSVRIEAGNDELEIVLVEDPGSPLRVLRWGPRGVTADAPAGQPAVEVVTVDNGHAPSTSRLTLGELSSRFRYAGHESSVDDRGWAVVEVALDEVVPSETTAQDPGLRATLRLFTPPTGRAARAEVTLHNASAEVRVVRSVASLALRVGLGASCATRPDDLVLSRGTSEWIGESRWRTDPLRAAGLADIRVAEHQTGSRGSLTFSSEGTWSTGRSLPTAVLAAADGIGALAWQIEHNAGWRWDLAEDDLGTSLALSGPTDSEHQWIAVLAPGEEFTTVPVTLAAGSDLADAVGGLTEFRRLARRDHPDNQSLGVVFNDYMNTLMGDPSTEKLVPLIRSAAEAGAEYFVIDAGWYDDDAGWWFSVGDWEPSTVRFPGGFAEVVAHIRDRGMIPGLWLEPEVVGLTSRAADRLPPDAFLQRHGVRIVEHGRYHLDFRHPAVIAHLDEVVDRLVSGLGVGYFKLDYNINPGAGTDVGAASAGDGLLEHNRAHLAWLDRVLDRHPGLVLENCGSGAMRMDQAMLQRLQLQSTSDQQEPEAYPPIAAAAPLMMLPEQAANWAYPQPDMDDEALAFTLCTAILGRFYLSGHIDEMTTSQTTLVAEAVAAHKRIRHALARSTASWPLGLDQWEAPWVALALGDADTRYLTLWRRSGSTASVEVPFPEFAGRELHLDTVFPERLDPWDLVWDASTGILHVHATGPEIAARTLRLATRRPQATVTVAADVSTGAVHGGAAGMLYGLGEPGVPSQALVEGVRPRTMAQKAPGGDQHPGGDAAVLAEGFFAAGGSEMVVYLQDALHAWPYEEIGIEAYASRISDLVAEVAVRSDRGSFTWVPFNEGDWIWYSDWSDAGRDRFLADWVTAFHAIRGADPGARIAGPNESQYFPRRVADFLENAVRTGTVPDVMSWHELSPSSLERYPAHYEHYRALEARLGVGPLPINIDEYGNKRDMSAPGQLVQWLALFESTKVDADLAYWTMAGNLDDHAVGTNQANGGWWLLHWYASLRGATVSTAVTTADDGVRDSVRAIGAVDAPGGVLRIIVGGGRDDVAVDVTGLADGAHRVRVSATTWTGYDGDAGLPPIVADFTAAPVDGTLRIDLPGGDRLAASLVVVVPAAAGAGSARTASPAPAASPAWRSQSFRASEARLVGCRLRRVGDDPQEYTAGGPLVVDGITHAGGSLAFDVEVPHPGRHLLGIVHATDARPGLVELTVDGEPHGPVELSATLSRTYFGRTDVPLDLTAGRHEIRIRRQAADEQGAGDVALDSITLQSDPGHLLARYETVDAWAGDGAALAVPGGSGAVPEWIDAADLADGAAPLVLGAGSSARFFVAARRRGVHRLTISAAGGLPSLLVDGHPIDLDAGCSAQVTLPLGISVVTVAAPVDGALVIRHLDVEEDIDADAAVGSWKIDHPVDATTERLRVPLDDVGDAVGLHLITFDYANGDRATGHLYNADVITRFADMTIEAGEGSDTAALRIPFAFTASWDGFREVSVVVDVPAGARALELTAAVGGGPRLRTIVMERLALPL